MKALDLFSGIGGFTKGIVDAGIPLNWHGYSEINEYAKSVYRLHFPQAEDLGDVRTIQPEGLPKLDLITFGFPCQDLSVAGKRGGIGASRSGLFFEAMRIVRIARPTYFVFENVKGIFSSNQGKDWLTVLGEVAECGYDGQWQLLNTRWFLPQNRERVYFIGHIRGERRPEVFPVGKNNGGATKRADETTSVRTLCGGGNSGGMHSGMTLISKTVRGGGQRQYDEEAHMGFSYSPVLTPNRPTKRQNGRRFKDDGEDMFTLTGQDVHGVMIRVYDGE